MKDIGGVLVNGDSSSTNSSTLESSGDDDYVFTEDQRRAALELQSLYRKLGLEDLDDGFEEGLSAYDDPHFDIVARLHEVNSRFEEDETPLESDRQRKVRFKETLVDLVVPISPVRNSHSPPEFDYSEYDDDFDDDYDNEDLRDMIDDEQLNTKEYTDDQLGNEKEEEEYDAENFVPPYDIVEPSAPPLFFPVNMVGEGETKDEQTSIEDETKEKMAYHEESDNVKQSFDENETKDVKSCDDDERNEEPSLSEDETKNEKLYDEGEDNVKNGFGEDDYEDEVIHIREISTELEDVSDNDDYPNVQSSVIPAETENELETSQSVLDKPSVLELVSDTVTDLQVNQESKSHLETVSQSEQKLDVCEQKPRVCGQKFGVDKSVEQPKKSKNNHENKGKEKNVPYDQKPVSPLGTKPKRPSRMSSPPCKPRSMIKKSSPDPVLRTSVSSEARQASAPLIKCGNSRSRYGLTEELRQELKRLKLLEATQKKQREHEQAEERRRRQEDADSAFKAWLEMKKRTKSASTSSGRDPSIRSPTRKVRPAC